MEFQIKKQDFRVPDVIHSILRNSSRGSMSLSLICDLLLQAPASIAEVQKRFGDELRDRAKYVISKKPINKFLLLPLLDILQPIETEAKIPYYKKGFHVQMSKDAKKRSTFRHLLESRFSNYVFHGTNFADPEEFQYFWPVDFQWEHAENEKGLLHYLNLAINSDSMRFALGFANATQEKWTRLHCVVGGFVCFLSCDIHRAVDGTLILDIPEFYVFNAVPLPMIHRTILVDYLNSQQKDYKSFLSEQQTKQLQNPSETQIYKTMEEKETAMLKDFTKLIRQFSIFVDFPLIPLESNTKIIKRQFQFSSNFRFDSTLADLYEFFKMQQTIHAKEGFALGKTIDEIILNVYHVPKKNLAQIPLCNFFQNLDVLSNVNPLYGRYYLNFEDSDIDELVIEEIATFSPFSNAISGSNQWKVVAENSEEVTDLSKKSAFELSFMSVISPEKSQKVAVSKKKEPHPRPPSKEDFPDLLTKKLN